MKNLLPQTIEGVCRKKRRFMELAQTESDLEQRDVYEQAINHCDKLTARITEKSKRRFRFFAILLCLCLLLGGCSAGVGVGADYDLFYPKKESVNADGTSTKFGDPAESREQVTRHGVSMQRNNLPMVGEDK